jgi:hypothetical protein
MQRSLALACLLAAVLGANGQVSSIVTDWHWAAQTTVTQVGVEHQQAGRLYGLVAAGRAAR